jgi:signal transduction histidine kinase
MVYVSPSSVSPGRFLRDRSLRKSAASRPGTDVPRAAIGVPATDSPRDNPGLAAVRTSRVDLAARTACLLIGFGLAYLAFGTATSSTVVALLVVAAILLLLAVSTHLPAPRSTQAVHRVALDRLESAIRFSDVRAGATSAERQRIGREIHDGVAQDVASLGYRIDDMSRLETDTEQREALDDVRRELGHILKDLRLSVAGLRHGLTDDIRLGSALTDFALDVGKRSSMAVHLSIEESLQRLQPDVETELLRIAQEAVTNAANHASAGNLWVTCRLEPPVATIRIDDDGVGVAAARADHFGIPIMRERAERIGAELSIDSRPGGGTSVSAVLRPRELPEPRLQFGASNGI